MVCDSVGPNMNTELQLVVGVVCFGTALVVLGTLAVFLRRATASAPGSERRTGRAVLVVLVVWYGVALVVGSRREMSFETFLPTALVPIAVGSALTFTSRGRALLVRVPVHWMVFLQVYRVAGGVFVYLYYAGDGVLSRGFALNAGWGDVLTGVLAIPVGILVMKRIHTESHTSRSFFAEKYRSKIET